MMLSRTLQHLGWRPIETAPRDRNIIGKFWHGNRYFIVEAAPRGDGGWQDVAHESCVGWMPGGKPAVWWTGGLP
jgi:hypothetical protein